MGKNLRLTLDVWRKRIPNRNGAAQFPRKVFYGPETRHDLEQTPRGAFGLSRSDKKMIYKNKKIFKKLMINISG